MSPLMNILLMYLSLLIGFDFEPFPFGVSVHISFTFSRTYGDRDVLVSKEVYTTSQVFYEGRRTMLQCRSNAFTRANNFLLFLQKINTYISWSKREG